MEFSRQEYWSRLPFSFPGDLLDLGIKPVSPASQADSLPSEPPGKLLPTESYKKHSPAHFCGLAGGSGGSPSAFCSSSLAVGTVPAVANLWITHFCKKLFRTQVP